MKPQTIIVGFILLCESNSLSSIDLIGRDNSYMDHLPFINGRHDLLPYPRLESSPISMSSDRRAFLSKVMATVISIDVLSPSIAEASVTESTYGVKKPKKQGGLANKVKAVGKILDELQRDLMQEKFDLVQKYPERLRSYVPVLTAFTDIAFPTDSATDQGQRVTLRYEVGRFFASLERLRQATSRRTLDEAYLAYSDMSIHYDRYLHVGGLYSNYDAAITNEVFFKGISDSSLVYEDPRKDPSLVRDLIVLVKGPDMGKTGIVIGVYLDGSKDCVVKLDRYKGLREIRVVPRMWAAKRIGEQQPDDVFIL